MKKRESSVAFALRLFRVLRWLTPVTLGVVAATVLIGWQLKIEALTTIIPQYVAMNPLTAVFFILIGIALVALMHGRSTKLMHACVYIVSFIVFMGGLAVFLRSVLGVEARADRILFADRLGVNLMAPNTALNFMFVGLSLTLMTFRGRWAIWLVRVACVLIASIATVAIVGYVVGLKPLYGIASFIPMAIHTATLFVLVATTLLASTMRGRMLVSRKILAGLGVIVLTVVANVSLILSNVNEVERLQTQAAETSDFTLRLEESAAKIIDAETGQRGYILTGNEVFLEPYNKAKDVPQDINNLLQSKNVSEEQISKLLEMNKLIHEKLAFIDETIALRKEKGFEAARAVVAGQKGKLIADELRAIYAHIRQGAVDDLTQATEAQRGANARSLSTILLGAALEIILLGAVYVVMVRENILRNAAERQLRHEKDQAQASEAQVSRLASIVESSQEAIISETLEGVIKTWNHGAEILYGYTAKEIIGTSASILAPPGHAHEIVDLINRVKQGERMPHYETRRVRKDQKVIDVALTISPIVDRNKITSVSVVARDITAQKRFERALEESNHRFELASKATNDAIYDADLTSGELKWGEGIITLFGYDNPTDLSNLDLWKGRIHPDDVPHVNKSFNNAVKGRGYHWHTNYRFKRADETYAYVQDRAFIVRDAEGKALRVIGSMMDVTHQKELEFAKDEFLSIASHQLRTPLTAIRLFSEMLAKEHAGKLNSKQKDYAIKINQSTDRMVRLVGDILNISRIQMGRLKINPQLQHLEDIVDSSVAELQPVAAQKSLQLNFKKPTLPPVMVDTVLMEQIVHNLLTNAMRYTAHGSVTVSVALNAKNDYILAVHDTGIGIPAAAQSKIFQRFYRAANAIRQEGEGTGLGLYLIKMVMDATGGKVWFESKEGAGTTFYVQIPKHGMKAHAGDKNLS